MSIASVTGCAHAAGCNPEGGELITISVVDVLRWDPAPRVSVSGAVCPSHCGGEAGTAECKIVNFKGWIAPAYEVTCQLPSGPAGGELDIVVAVGGKQATFVGLKFAGCPAGQAPGGINGECANCEPGKFAVPGDLVCEECAGDTFAPAGAALCRPCPTTPGIECPAGVLTPQDGWWSPALLPPADGAAAPTDGATAPFERDTVLFECTKRRACLAAGVPPNATRGGATPADAFVCAAHHVGVLCSQCAPHFFMGPDDRCEKCGETQLSVTAEAAMAAAALAGTLAAGLLLLLRKNAAKINRRLTLAGDAVRRRRATLTKSLTRMGAPVSGGVSASAAAAAAVAGARWRRRASLHNARSALWTRARLHALSFRAWSVSAAHGVVRVSKGGHDVVVETPQIVVGFGQVVHHLYGSLDYCILLVKVLQNTGLKRKCRVAQLLLDSHCCSARCCPMTGGPKK